MIGRVVLGLAIRERSRPRGCRVEFADGSVTPLRGLVYGGREETGRHSWHAWCDLRGEDNPPRRLRWAYLPKGVALHVDYL